jgi:hypothetical protein
MAMTAALPDTVIPLAGGAFWETLISVNWAW